MTPDRAALIRSPRTEGVQHHGAVCDKRLAHHRIHSKTFIEERRLFEEPPEPRLRTGCELRV